MRKLITGLFAITLLVACQESTSPVPEMKESEPFSSSEKKKEMFLLGTFHFNNPGADVVKTKSFDILSESAQADLDLLSKQIGDFGPSKIFVEWEWDDQQALDSLYSLYRAGTYFNDTTLSDFYRKNEIFQLAFRAADLLGHERVYAIDYLGTTFPFDSMMNDIASADQEELQADFAALMETFTTSFDDKITEGKGLCELYAYLNAEELRSMDRSIYTALSVRAGAKGQFTGAYLAAEWYRRNLYMWSNMLKEIDGDERVMALMGAGHVSMIDRFVENEREWRSVSIDEVFGDCASAH